MILNENTNIAIISHFTFKDNEKGAVFPQSIRNYLRKRIGILTYIDHPFPGANFPFSQIRIYKNKFNFFQSISPVLKLPTILLFTFQFFLTIFFMLSKPVRYDLCLACDNLSFFSVFIFRKFGMIKKIIYYTVDYSPRRFNNFFLNTVYQFLDKTACKLSDVNWVAVENIITEKEKNGLNFKKCAPFQVVPMGFDKEDINIKPIGKKNIFNLVFVGLLFEKQGLQLAIRSLPRLIKKYPKIFLTIIGSGPFEANLKNIVYNLGVSDKVKFTGYINDHRKIVEVLTNCGIGLATYVPSIGDYSYSADPSKIKLYLLCGLPVIATRVPPIAKEITNKKAGAIINYSEEDLITGVDKLLKEYGTYNQFRKNALKMSKVYDISLILDKAFGRLA